MAGALVVEGGREESEFRHAMSAVVSWLTAGSGFGLKEVP